jgi:predicted tellurium resistance membrane protein TerC
MIDQTATLLLLLGLELVLGVDNILVIAILVERLPPEKQKLARVTGLALALMARLAMLFGVTWLIRLTDPVTLGLSIKDLVLLAGGLFLLFKAVKEIHHTVEGMDHAEAQTKRKASFSSVITQIVMLDIVFSLDSVITAVGLSDELWVIITAVVAAFAVIIVFAETIGEFILKRPALKILALAFLVTIGVTLVMEGLHQHVPKGYIYLPMGFALVIELLQMRYDSKHRKSN